MQTQRLLFRQRTQALMQQVLSQPTEKQLAFFGYDNTDALQAELTKIEKNLATNPNDRTKWDLIDKSTGSTIGACMFFNWHREHERAEIGYKLHKKYHGQGYMTEALKTVIDYGFNEMNLNRIEALIGPDNEPSKRIAEKFGFKYEGLLREHYKVGDELQDSLIFSLLRSEYQPK